MSAINPKNYRRLSAYTDRGFLTSIGRRQELWLGPDHLLELYILRYSEQSRRYYLRDIRAITVDQTDARRLYTLLWLGFATLFAATAVLLFTVGGTNPVALGFGAAAGGGTALMLLGLLRNTVSGPTCRCRLHTAVQSADLFSLPRLRKAERFLREIVPAIEAEQGPVDVETFAQSPEAGRIVASPFTLGADRAVRHESGAVHTAFFGFLVLDAIATVLLLLFTEDPTTNPLNAVSLLAYVSLNIWAFMRQANSDLSNSIKNVTWGAFALLVAAFIIGQSAAMIYIGMNPEMYDPYEAAFSFEQYAPITYFFSGVQALLGIAGLYLVAQHRRLHRALARAAELP